MIKRIHNGLHQVEAYLRDLEEEESMEGSSMGRERIGIIAIGPEGDKDPPLPVEMEILDGKGHLGSEGSLDDDMQFVIRRLFVEDDASKGINDLPYLSLGSVSHNLPLVLYHNSNKFLSNLIKTIRVQSVHTNYKASASSSEISSSGIILQGSLQPGFRGFVLLT